MSGQKLFDLLEPEFGSADEVDRFCNQPLQKDLIVLSKLFESNKDKLNF